MNEQVQIFEFSDGTHSDKIRTVKKDNEVWFVGTDVAASLGYSNTSKAISDHCKEKGITKRYPLLTSGGSQLVTIINEPNLYRLIGKSQLPAAEKFEQWIFEDVLPSIRKHGSYSIKNAKSSNFVSRYFENAGKIPNGNFSVITELYVKLYGKLEHLGYIIPDKGKFGKEMRPDVSVGGSTSPVAICAIITAR